MANPSWIGRKLSDRYEIEELLGQGGMSSVYKANDPNLRRTVAVKLIHPHLSTDPQFVSRFEEEAAAVAQLRNPNIIQVYDFAHDDDTYYMVLEFVPGETIQEQLERLEKDNRRMATKDAVKYIASICDALDYAHTRGMIHRDIKPANIMLNLQGQAILMDFGVAKIIGGKEHTATGAVVGTALYMSPEIIKGEAPDRRVDIYALGVTMFEALTGKPPFEADSAMSTLMMHVNDPVPDIRQVNPDVPVGLVEVVRKALAKDKNDRYATAADFAKALRAVDLSKGGASAESVPQSPGGTMIEEVPQSVGSPGATMIEDAPQSLPSGGATMIEQTPAIESQPQPSGRIPQPPPRPGSAAAKKGGSKLPLMLGAGGIGIIGVVIVGFLVLRALFGSGGGDDVDVDPTEPVAVVATEVPAVESTTAPPTEEATAAIPTATLEPTAPPTATDPAGPFVRINAITLNGDSYSVEYETFGYTEALPGMHVHFFFDSVAPEQAGAGGSGPWFVWGGPRPFGGYNTGDRPGSASQMCALVANPNHTVQLSTGNCVALP